MSKGWKIIDDSISQWGGLATKEGLVLVVDVDRFSPMLRRSGKGKRYPQINTYGPCTSCDGAGEMLDDERAIVISVDDQDFILQQGHDKGDRCAGCKGSGSTWESRGYVIGEVWPDFQANPGTALWHVERDGEVITSGARLSHHRNIIRKIEFAARGAS